MTFVARFNGGPCGKCEERIRENQEVEYDSTDTLVHAVCPEALDVDPPGALCPVHFIELPVSGVCEACQ